MFVASHFVCSHPSWTKKININKLEIVCLKPIPMQKVSESKAVQNGNFEGVCFLIFMLPLHHVSKKTTIRKLAIFGHQQSLYKRKIQTGLFIMGILEVAFFLRFCAADHPCVPNDK